MHIQLLHRSPPYAKLIGKLVKWTLFCQFHVIYRNNLSRPDSILNKFALFYAMKYSFAMENYRTEQRKKAKIKFHCI